MPVSRNQRPGRRPKRNGKDSFARCVRRVLSMLGWTPRNDQGWRTVSAMAGNLKRSQPKGAARYYRSMR